MWFFYNDCNNSIALFISDWFSRWIRVMVSCQEHCVTVALKYAFLERWILGIHALLRVITCSWHLTASHCCSRHKWSIDYCCCINCIRNCCNCCDARTLGYCSHYRNLTGKLFLLLEWFMLAPRAVRSNFTMCLYSRSQCFKPVDQWQLILCLQNVAVSLDNLCQLKWWQLI